MSTRNADRLERLSLDGFGGGDLSVLDEVVAGNFVEHQQGHSRGKENLRGSIRTLRRAFPVLSYAVVQMVADGDKVWGHYMSRVLVRETEKTSVYDPFGGSGQ